MKSKKKKKEKKSKKKKEKKKDKKEKRKTEAGDASSVDSEVDRLPCMTLRYKHTNDLSTSFSEWFNKDVLIISITENIFLV